MVPFCCHLLKVSTQGVARVSGESPDLDAQFGLVRIPVMLQSTVVGGSDSQHLVFTVPTGACQPNSHFCANLQ